ncbi:hypothetical protein NQ318_023210 [Aromia moschata]|uniref:Cytochrome c oxidase polypeptide VIa n=1 Tax=Aromia moschata TaxID=1265417 RepID=A0AAV8XIU1_9CUCU|nr:hypothetical protein NQ318_023210 [Aromia moschata]
MYSMPRQIKLNSFTKRLHHQKTRKPCPVPGSGHLPKDGSYKIYKLLTFFVGIPAIAVAGINTYQSKQSRKSECERPPFVKYEYLRRRTKRFPWGDGNKSFFHNPEVNPLPDGYEEPEE